MLKFGRRLRVEGVPKLLPTYLFRESQGPGMLPEKLEVVDAFQLPGLML